jgi:hypothetical protein
MAAFAEELKSIRRETGHRSARSFFDWLSERGVAFNYSYYMRLEQGGLPSEKLVQELAAAVGEPFADRLVLAYCRALFPKQKYLFAKPAAKTSAPISSLPESRAPSSQKELTLRQVAAIASAESVYHLFLLVTLSRRAISRAETAPLFKPKAYDQAVKLLTAEGILRESDEGISAVSVEARFPDSYNQELKDAYARFDLWDESFGHQFALEQLLNKMLLRRVSGRYLAIIRKQLEALFDLVKSSDETDTRYNDTVLQMKVVLRQGKLPG